MKRYAFESPPGWEQRPFPAPQQGVYLTAPAGTPKASILLMDAVEIDGELAAQLERMVDEGCAGAEILQRAAAQPLPRADGLPGMVAVAKVKATHEGKSREEGRAFALFEGRNERLPVVFLGDLDALPFHRGAVNRLLASIRLLAVDADLLY